MGARGRYSGFGRRWLILYFNSFIDQGNSRETDGSVILWKQADAETTAAAGDELDEFNKEHWKIQQLLR